MTPQPATANIVETTRGAVPMRVLIRKPRPSDQGYVASTWIQSLCKADASAREGIVGLLIDSVLDHPNVSCLLACNPDEPRAIYGWLVWSPMRAIRLIHFAYVRGALRDRGIAAALRTAAQLDDNERPLVYTMRGPAHKSLARKYPHAIEQPIGEFLE